LQTFCRHNRFIQRCPICKETVPGFSSPEGQAGLSPAARVSRRRSKEVSKRARQIKVRHEGRPEDDGYRSDLLPGLRSSQDAERLAEEIAFSNARLLALAASPPRLYADARELDDFELAAWTCFLAVYLSPLQDDDPFAGIRVALQSDWRSGELPDLREIPLGPRTSHDPARDGETLHAYLQWVQRAGSAENALTADQAWTPQRRFERVFERLAFPGFGRMGRYELLVTLGRLGMYELKASALQIGVGAVAAIDHTPSAAKRVFGIGDPLSIERRALALAEALSVEIAVLDLALANWGAGERARLGVPESAFDVHALERAQAALEL
jgi:Alpha-glutamyl/putrescinyl thymine pyrophosphorylase clade 3